MPLWVLKMPREPRQQARKRVNQLQLAAQTSVVVVAVVVVVMVKAGRQVSAALK